MCCAIKIRMGRLVVYGFLYVLALPTSLFLSSSPLLRKLRREARPMPFDRTHTCSVCPVVPD